MQLRRAGTSGTSFRSRGKNAFLPFDTAVELVRTFKLKNRLVHLDLGHVPYVL